MRADRIGCEVAAAALANGVAPAVRVSQEGLPRWAGANGLRARTALHGEHRVPR